MQQQPTWLNGSEYPFRSRWWRTPEGRVHYIDEGEGDAIVFVHGVPAWSYNFRHQIRRLSQTHRCVAMDHLGFGLSDKPDPWPYAPQHLAQHVEGLIDGLGLERVTLVVHDWGGPLGLWYALNNRGNVARLVILNTWLWSAVGDLRTQAVAWFLASPIYAALEDRMAITTRVFTRLAVARRDRVDAGTFVHFEAPFRNRAGRAGLKAMVRAIKTSDPWVGSLWEERRALRSIPTLILWGMKDPAFPPRYLKRWVDLFTEAEVHRLSGVGHFPHEEVPDRVTTSIEEFCDRPDDRSGSGRDVDCGGCPEQIG